MPRKTFIDLLIENAEKRKEYFANFVKYAEKVKEVVKRLDPEARVIIFGSVVRENVRPDSDIDLLIITRIAENLYERIKLRIRIMEILGEESPFELHIVSVEEYENWYRRFIDQFIEL
ncbi:MAG: nucleotidyltransferase domain-containing protein [Thaumarchaeota archaeon]|nr:nucleotidyltransferase domain-containing protein [Nitrososphaerota archaeon]